ncbi:hypothetical protein CK203_062084 [Vitis vinifera]|uniref:Uncharacterized protein n=1 Tax=Vitis vinifera TaxID=29760 RepID=A0A438GMU4_VITVI|nr:hypothetical protein CK203_062084 [Vitis vinifera]
MEEAKTMKTPMSSSIKLDMDEKGFSFWECFFSALRASGLVQLHFREPRASGTSRAQGKCPAKPSQLEQTEARRKMRLFIPGRPIAWRTRIIHSFGSLRQVKQRREAKRSKVKQSEKNQRTAAAVFFHTFGALSEVHFLHTIYHFKALEVKNPTLQTVHDLELK